MIFSQLASRTQSHLPLSVLSSQSLSVLISPYTSSYQSKQTPELCIFEACFKNIFCLRFSSIVLTDDWREAVFGNSKDVIIVQIGMNFEEEFSQPLTHEPSLPEIIQEDRAGVGESKSLKLELLVKFFNRFSNMRGVKKSNYVKEFLKILFRADRSPAFVYPILRLMLPSDDRDRGNYGLKERNLSKVISDSLNLTKQDYLRLHHYKNPSFHKNGVGIGDFSLCVSQVINNFCRQNASLTIVDLNDMLDEMAGSSGRHVPVFRKLFMVATPEEIKWIIRIILKDLKISMRIETVLGAFHSDAHDFFNLTNSLIETCKKFEDASVSLDDEIKLFFPIRPMLAGKKKINFFSESQKMYYVETKFDGERLQAHKKGSQVRLFSRNGVDYSKIYEEFVEVIRSHIDADECILDGEIIVIEKDTMEMVAFGKNKVVALNKESTDQRLCFKIFDIMWLREQNEEINLMKYQLRARKEILTKIVKHQVGVIEVVKHQEITEYDDILRRFSQSLDRSEEGIMVKDPHSLYFPKERGSNWIKLKGDYIEGLTDTVDLIILGGYFGDSTARYGPSRHWSDQITSFLLGVIDRVDPLNPQIAYMVPFAKVGTGYSMDQLNQLRGRLRDNLSKNEGKFKPSYIECKWKPGIQDKPDCWITNITRSVVLEIKAAELIVTENYPTGHTLRFPRVVKIRYDKDWNEAETMKFIEELKDTAIYGKNLKRKLDGSDSDGEREKEQRSREAGDKTTKRVKKDKEAKREGVYSEYLGFDMANENILSHLFHGFELCVFELGQSKHSKSEIERQILMHEGMVVQNPLPSTQYIVTETIDFKLRAYQTQRGEKYTFIKPNYIINCIGASKILKLSPLYLMVLPQGNAKYYMDNFDRFGDSYTDFLDVRELNEMLDSMAGTYPVNQRLVDHIGLKKRRAGKVSICFGVSELDKVKLKMHGNAIIGNFKEEPNSVIVGAKLLPFQVRDIDRYRDSGGNCLVEQLEELVAIGLL